MRWWRLSCRSFAAAGVAGGVVLLAGCTGVEKPRVEVEGVRVVEASNRGAAVVATLRAVNPNAATLPIERVEYKLEVAGAESVFESWDEPPAAMTGTAVGVVPGGGEPAAAEPAAASQRRALGGVQRRALGEGREGVQRFEVAAGVPGGPDASAAEPASASALGGAELWRGRRYRLTGEVVYEADTRRRAILRETGIPAPRVAFEAEGVLE